MEIEEINGRVRASAYRRALRDARIATGRNPADGEKTNEFLHGNWLGALGYLSLLDQIGTCFKPINMVKSEGRNSIIKALNCFSDLDKQESFALFALRCSFAHDFSLFNIPSEKDRDKELLTHHFTVGIGNEFPLVYLPFRLWSGKHEDRNKYNKTFVNLEKLGDLVEEICGKIQALADSGQLGFVLKGESDELIYRYNAIWSEKR